MELMEKKYFYFGKSICARANSRLNNETIAALWKGFCHQSGFLVMEEIDDICFRAGPIGIPEVPEGKEFAVQVTEQGIAVAAKDYSGLARGLMVLMMRIEAVDLTEGCEQFRIETCQLESNYSMKTRMIHFCVFPETTPAFLKKCIRLAGAMQYTHVVLEFWGMLQFDCLKELAWENAYSKEFARSLVKEIKAMGMQAIPMFNHMGHAAAARVSSGKHVVLDQNPRLATLFAPDGWSWNIGAEPVKALMEAIRQELYEVFDDPEYFHLGCDEIFSYDETEASMSLVENYLRELTRTVIREGKRPIVWGDMMLHPEICGVEKPYYCGCNMPEKAAKLLKALAPETVIGDWQYDVKEAPIKTSVYLKEQGFDVLGTSCLIPKNAEAHMKTVKDHDLMGVMVTTWHTLAQQMPHIVANALLYGAYHSPWSGEGSNQLSTETATLLRKVCFVEGKYEDSGWTDFQIFLQANPMT